MFGCIFRLWNDKSRDSLFLRPRTMDPWAAICHLCVVIILIDSRTGQLDVYACYTRKKRNECLADLEAMLRYKLHYQGRSIWKNSVPQGPGRQNGSTEEVIPVSIVRQGKTLVHLKRSRQRDVLYCSSRQLAVKNRPVFWCDTAMDCFFKR